MAKWRTYRFACSECNHSDALLFDMDDAEEVEASKSIIPCPDCGMPTFGPIPYISAAGANTSKTSKSYPDGIRKFNERREERKLERAISKAKREGDKATLIDATKESVAQGKLVKGLPTRKDLLNGK